MNLAVLNRDEGRKFRKIANKCIAANAKELSVMSLGQGKWPCEFAYSNRLLFPRVCTPLNCQSNIVDADAALLSANIGEMMLCGKNFRP